jgi:hypothetical protein
MELLFIIGALIVHFNEENFMVTYLYWTATVATAILVCWMLGRFYKWTWGFVMGFLVLAASWLAFHFHYEQIFVRNYGGVMSIAVPEGQVHIAITWKDEHLWVENYDPLTNTCYFTEYSKGHFLQGSVAIENCNPIAVVNTHKL